MITLRVKTLSGGDHPFTVDESMTIEAFKQEIATTVDILPDSQRLIYMGRALNNSQTLQELDLDGKTVHLVSRLPPSEFIDTNLSRSSSTTPRPNPFHLSSTPDPDVIFSQVQTTIDNSINNFGQVGFVHGRRLESRRNYGVEINLVSLHHISDVNYRIFLLKKFFECAERVLQAFQMDNNDDNFSDLDYINEEQRICLADNTMQRQPSPQFRGSHSMEFFSSLVDNQSITIDHISFLDDIYLNLSAFNRRFLSAMGEFSMRNQNFRSNRERLTTFETRRNRISHYLSHIYHGLSELTTVIGANEENQLVITDSLNDNGNIRNTLIRRMRDNISRLNSRLSGVSAVVFPRTRHGNDSAVATENEEGNSGERTTQVDNPPTSREMRTSNFNIDTIVEASISQILPNNEGGTRTRRLRRRNPFSRIISNDSSGGLTLASTGFLPLIDPPVTTQQNVIHTQLDPFLQCHSVCCETELHPDPTDTPTTVVDINLGGTRSTAPSTSSLLVQQDSESEFPRSTNFSDSANLGNSVSFDEDSDSHSQSVLTVPDDTPNLVADRTIQTTEPTTESAAENQVEDWMRDVPSDWIDVIVSDQAVQASSEHSQPPFSDAYISGMPAKRRKVIEEEKANNGVSSPEDLVSIISSASQNLMVDPSVPLSNLTSVIQADESLMNSFNGLVREKIRRRLENDPNFDYDSHPSARSL